MQNRATLARATGFRGFSWTTLFFGFFPALFRGHVMAAVIMFAAAFVTFGIAWLIFPFIYNRWHFNWLSHAGFVPVEELNAAMAMNMRLQGA